MARTKIKRIKKRFYNKCWGFGFGIYFFRGKIKKEKHSGEESAKMKSLQITKEIQAMLQEDYNTKILGLSNVCVEEIQENAEVNRMHFIFSIFFIFSYPNI